LKLQTAERLCRGGQLAGDHPAKIQNSRPSSRERPPNPVLSSSSCDLPACSLHCRPPSFHPSIHPFSRSFINAIKQSSWKTSPSRHQPSSIVSFCHPPPFLTEVTRHSPFARIKGGQGVVLKRSKHSRHQQLHLQSPDRQFRRQQAKASSNLPIIFDGESAGRKPIEQTEVRGGTTTIQAPTLPSPITA
jgi:hypothetical protein